MQKRRQSKLQANVGGPQKRNEKSFNKMNKRTSMALDQKSSAASDHKMPIVNLNLGEHANVSIVDLSTKVNIQSNGGAEELHNEEDFGGTVAFDNPQSQFMANPGAFMTHLANTNK